MNCHLLSAKHYNQFWLQTETLFSSTPTFWSGKNPKSTEYLSPCSGWEGIRLCQEQWFLPHLSVRGNGIFETIMWGFYWFDVADFWSCCLSLQLVLLLLPKQLLDPCLNSGVKITKVFAQTNASHCIFACIITLLLIYFESGGERREEEPPSMWAVSFIICSVMHSVTIAGYSF